MRLLVTRPEPDASRTAATLRMRGHEVLLHPLLRMIAVPEPSLGSGPWAGLILTSANAMRAIASHHRRDELLDLLVLAVGARTADAARESGFSNVKSADGNAGDLIALASATFKSVHRPLLYLAGEEQSADIAGSLGAFGIRVHTVVTYRMEKGEAFSQELIDCFAARRVDGVLHYSKRTAEAYVGCANVMGQGSAAFAPVHYCLSCEVAGPLQSAGASMVKIAAQPDEAALLQLLD